MALQICPKCKTESFIWTSDEDDAPLTFWHCGNCKYSAHEDESLLCVCGKCNTKTKCKLKDTEREYWWCAKCNDINE